MTREEAKAYIIQHCIPNYPKMDKTEWDAAMGKAIEALRQPDPRSFSCSQENDLISRREALNAITDELMQSTPLSAVIRAKNRLKDLSAVQPERIRCKDCKYWRDDHTCHEHSLVSPMCANEYCSRAERRTDD